MRETKIALVQATAVLGDKEANFKKTETFVRAAAAQRVRIICFPELNLCGYGKDISLLQPEPVPGPSSSRLRELAKENNIVILAGIAELEKERVYTTQLVAFPDGRIEKYRKTHIGPERQEVFTPGDKLPVFSAQSASFAIGICYDLHFPEAVAALACAGAEILFAPFASLMDAKRRLAVWNKYMVARAYDNGIYVAACNQVGHNGKQDFGGGIAVWNPQGNLIDQYSEKDEAIKIIDLDPSAVNLLRDEKKQGMKNRFFLRDRRPELYIYNNRSS